MSWAAVEAAVDGILERRWYTNHGPMAHALEAEVARLASVRHAIAATNPVIALIMLIEALELHGAVLVPALAPMRCAQAVRWAGLRPVFGEVDGERFSTTKGIADGAIGPEVEAIMLAAGADEGGLMALAAARGLRVLRDGPGGGGVPSVLHLAGCGDDAGAGCVLTDDDLLAARLRSIRSSYGAGTPVPVARTANGRLSEAQAAMALLEIAAHGLPRPCAPGGAAFAGRRVAVFGDHLGVVANDPEERVWLQNVLEAGGRRVGRLGVCSPPGVCPMAEAVAARIVLVGA